MSFVDTNVLVHAATLLSPEASRAQAAVTRLMSSGDATISRQVLREYLCVMTRPQPWAGALTIADAMLRAAAFADAFRVVEDSPSVWAALARLAVVGDFGGKQVHDANLVATMLAHGETRLLTFNAKHFRRFAGLIEIVEP